MESGDARSTSTEFSRLSADSVHQATLVPSIIETTTDQTVSRVRRQHPRERRLLCMGVAVAAFALYFSSVGPMVTYGGDCGGLIAASYRLGIAHPAG